MTNHRESNYAIETIDYLVRNGTLTGGYQTDIGDAYQYIDERDGSRWEIYLEDTKFDDYQSAEEIIEKAWGVHNRDERETYFVLEEDE